LDASASKEVLPERKHHVSNQAEEPKPIPIGRGNSTEGRGRGTSGTGRGRGTSGTGRGRGAAGRGRGTGMGRGVQKPGPTAPVKKPDFSQAASTTTTTTTTKLPSTTSGKSTPTTSGKSTPSTSGKSTPTKGGSSTQLVQAKEIEFISLYSSVNLVVTYAVSGNIRINIKSNNIPLNTIQVVLFCEVAEILPEGSSSNSIDNLEPNATKELSFTSSLEEVALTIRFSLTYIIGETTISVDPTSFDVPVSKFVTNKKLEKTDFYQMLREGALSHITVKKVNSPLNKSTIDDFCEKLNIALVENGDGKASFYGITFSKGNHVAVLLKAEGQNQLAAAVRSNNLQLSKAFANEVGKISFSSSLLL